MSNVELHLNQHRRGGFTVAGDSGQWGKMEIAIEGKHVIVYHTEVTKAAEGKGFAKQLLDAMVSYARQHNLKVIPLCSYTNTQFIKHPELYEDVWEKNIPRDLIPDDN